jgi:WD40 repeat protein
MYRTKDRKIGDDYNLIRAFPSLPGRIFDVRYNKDGSRIIVGASSNGKGEVRVYSAGDGKQIAKLDGERGPVYAVAFRPDGKEVASAGFDGVVRLNDPDNGKLIREFVPCPLRSSATALENPR